jgi:hypothetical protein
MDGMARKAKRWRQPRLELSEPQILTWADAHHARTGQWPHMDSGLVRDELGENWRKADTALRYGLRGLGGGSSLARLLAQHRGVRNLRELPPLSPQHILAWSDAYHRRTGRWPTSESGPVAEAPGQTWRGVDQALRVGVRGLAGGSSLARLLAQHRHARNAQRLPRLTLRRILSWADAHHRRTGAWPTSESGSVRQAPGETWVAINAALWRGGRGLAGGSSLARLLAARRGARNLKELPRLTITQVLAWARAHRRRTGAWPTAASGPIRELPGETWRAVHAALVGGYRGLPAGLTLARLIGARPTAPRALELPRLTLARVLAWADAHRRRTGAWPRARAGPVAAAPGETWRGIDQALRTGQRGLAGGLSLFRLLAERRGVRMRPYAPPLQRGRILAWARAHRRRTGAWPMARSGPIAEAPGESWRAVDEALRGGRRGLRGRLGLARLLARAAGARNRTSLPRLTLAQVLVWADAHHRRTGAWPTDNSGPVVDAAGETWKAAAMALRFGYRGLQGGLSLARLLAVQRGVRNRASLPRLSVTQVLAWAQKHLRRTGSWPNEDSGPVVAAAGETWSAIDLALRYGHRGLPGGSSLARLVGQRRG